MVKLKIIHCLLIPSVLMFLSSAQALTLSGYTQFASVIRINTATAGTIQSIPVKPGHQVNKGEVLIRLDKTPYQAKLDQMAAIEKSLLPAMVTAELELERAQELYDRDSLSEVELKKAENNFLKAEGDYQAAQADRALAEYALNNTLIVAPVAGRVIDITANEAQYVDPAVNNGALMTLVNTRSMKAVALINSEQWFQSLLNKRATVKYREKTFNGVVSFLGLKRVKQNSGLPAYEIHVSFETELLIPAEMPVSIEIRD